jgi:hypothetical protein
LWGFDEYKNLVLLTPPIQIDTSRDKFWEAFNYAPRLYIQGARIPYVKRQIEIANKYGSIQSFLNEVLDLKGNFQLSELNNNQDLY